MNILVVDDEKEIADLIEIVLKNASYHVDKYYESEEVLKNIENLSIDLAILDVMMPEVDGFTLCKKLREKYNFPIIFVTAKVEDLDKVNGLIKKIFLKTTLIFETYVLIMILMNFY